jgi:hypothetical protein
MGPFAGGAGVALSVAFEGLAGRSVLVERDDSVAAVWKAALGGHAQELADRITSFRPPRSIGWRRTPASPSAPWTGPRPRWGSSSPGGATAGASWWWGLPDGFVPAFPPTPPPETAPGSTAPDLPYRRIPRFDEEHSGSPRDEQW